MSRATQKTTPEVKRWYATHRTKSAIGFDPDGMCQKICRTPRNIGPGAPSALASALSTPEQYRIRRISEIVVGDVMYFDDPRDSNPFGHIVTVMERDPKVDPDWLSSLLVDTNSVQADRLTRVRADYFKRVWGDSFQWGGRWLNGEPFYDLVDQDKAAEAAAKAKAEKAKKRTRIEALRDQIQALLQTDERLKGAMREFPKDTRYQNILQRDREVLRKRIAAKRDQIQKLRR